MLVGSADMGAINHCDVDMRKLLREHGVMSNFPRE